MKLKLCFSFLLFIVHGSNGARILCFFPVMSRSMAIIAQHLMIELANRDHNVTMVSPFALGKDVPNYHEVVIASNTEAHSSFTKSLLEEKSKSIFANLNKLVNMMMQTANMTMVHGDFKKIMAKEKFDLIIFSFALTTFQQGLAAHFNCPYIVLSSSPSTAILNEMIGQTINPEAVPSYFLGIQRRMNFWKRFVNMALTIGEMILNKYYDRVSLAMYKEHFPEDQYPPFDEVKNNVSLILVNSHFSLNGVRPLLPNLVEVGGLQIKEKPDPLPGDIKDFIENASSGVAVVSLGSNFKSSDMTPEKIQMFFNAFAKIPLRVIWKFEADHVLNLPKNVMTVRWLPQDDILAHEKTRLFISHCEISSYNEALYHGVPIVGVPIAGDQPINAQKAKDEGWAEVVPLVDMTQDALDAAIEKVLNNPMYAKAVKNLSELYRDRPMTPLQTAVFWVEYVIRHKGAPHLHYQGADLNLFQKLSIDVWIVNIPFWIFLMWCVRFIFKCSWWLLVFTWQKISGKDQEKNKTKKTN